MNYIVVNQENRLQVILSLADQIKTATLILSSQHQLQFYTLLCQLLKINHLNFTTEYDQSQKLPIFCDKIPHTTNGIVLIYEEDIPILPQNSIESKKTKQLQFATENTQKLVSKNYKLYQLADKAYKDYITNYKGNAEINPHELCKSYGFEVTPKLNNFRLKKQQEYKTMSNKSKKVKKSQLSK